MSHNIDLMSVRSLIVRSNLCHNITLPLTADMMDVTVLECKQQLCELVGMIWWEGAQFRLLPKDFRLICYVGSNKWGGGDCKTMDHGRTLDEYHIGRHTSLDGADINVVFRFAPRKSKDQALKKHLVDKFGEKKERIIPHKDAIVQTCQHGADQYTPCGFCKEEEEEELIVVSSTQLPVHVPTEEGLTPQQLSQIQSPSTAAEPVKGSFRCCVISVLLLLSSLILLLLLLL